MTLYLCLFREGGAYLSTEPDGDANQAITLEPQDGEMVAHLLGLQSFVAAQALASLYLAGVAAGGRPRPPKGSWASPTSPRSWAAA